MIVIVGLGNMGAALGRRLAATSGSAVVGVELSADLRSAWSTATASVAVPSLSDVEWTQDDHVFVVVRMTAQAETVLDELAAVEAGGSRTAWVVTTLEPERAREIGRHSGRGLRVIESPVSGGDVGADEGRLTVMVAGPVTDTDRALLTGTVAAHVVEFGSYGEPTLAKLLNNVLGAYNASAFAEMIGLGIRLGLDPARLRAVFSTSSGGSWMAAAFDDLLDDLLAKDVALLDAHVTGLPVIDLDHGAATFAARLDAARRSLRPDHQVDR